MDGAIAALWCVVGILLLFLALVFGWIVANESWIRECNALGTHLYQSKIYECKERK